MLSGIATSGTVTGAGIATRAGDAGEVVARAWRNCDSLRATVWDGEGGGAGGSVAVGDVYGIVIGGTGGIESRVPSDSDVGGAASIFCARGRT